MLLRSVNALPGDLGTQLVGVIKVPSVHDVFLSFVLFDLYTYNVSLASHCNQFPVVVLDASHITYQQIVFVGGAYRCSDPELTTKHLTSQKDWILLPENVLLVNLQLSREDNGFA